MLWVGQFGVEGGEARESTPWVGVYQDSARAEDPANLYVLVNPALPGSEEFCGEMKDAIGGAFHREKASLTGGVLRALQKAHENLRDWNRRSLKDHRVAAGVSCLAARDGRAYLGQVGPSATAYFHAGHLTMIRPSLPDSTEPIGLFDEFWPEFTAFDLLEGDRLLMLSPAFADGLTETDVAGLLALPAEDALAELYRLARGLEDCAALLVAAVPDAVVA